VDPCFAESLRFKSTPTDQPYTKANFGLFIVCIDCASDKPDSVTVYQVDSVENGENPTIMTEFKVNNIRK
jgi:hypothetical protein